MLYYLSLVGICLVFSLVNAEWKLVFSDNFNRNGRVDSTKWTFDEGGHGWGIYLISLFLEF
jgi:hypothetical protein